MPVYEVECLATVKKIYVIEARDEKMAFETAALNEPEDEIEVSSETVRVTLAADQTCPTFEEMRGVLKDADTRPSETIVREQRETEWK